MYLLLHISKFIFIIRFLSPFIYLIVKDFSFNLFLILYLIMKILITFQILIIKKIIHIRFFLSPHKKLKFFINYYLNFKLFFKPFCKKFSKKSITICIKNVFIIFVVNLLIISCSSISIFFPFHFIHLPKNQIDSVPFHF